MTKAFNELIEKQQVLHELAVPPVSVVTQVPDWVKEVDQVIEKCYQSSRGVLQSQYLKSIGRIAQKNVHLAFFPVQDLIRLLNANVKINPKGAFANTAIPWEDFIQKVEDNKEEPDIKNILVQWKAQLQDGDYEAYVIKDPALAKEYGNKKKDKETASVAALSTYNNDTIYDAVVKIVERRIAPLQQFEGEMAKRLGNVTKYEAVLRTILNSPADVAASVKRLPGEFFKYCEIEPRSLVALSLACAEFYSVECARVASLAIERKAKEREQGSIPFSSQIGPNKSPEQLELSEPVTKKAKPIRDEKGNYAKAQRELDLSSLQAFDKILNFTSFEKFTKKRNVLTEADMWGSLASYVKQNGKKAIQNIWSGVKFALTGTKKLPSSITEYESFLRTGVIKTSLNVPNNKLVPGIEPVFDVVLQIDSAKERMNNRAVIYKIDLITALADQPNAKEALALRDILRQLAENIGRDEEDYAGNAAKAFAAAS
jgi:hypothetical protein